MHRSPYDSRIGALAWPALGALAIDPLVSLVDTFFVTRLGDTELAALGVAGGVFGLAFFVFNFLAYGVTPLIAEADAEGRRAEVGNVVLRGLTLAVALGVAGMVFLESAAEPVARAMGASEEVLQGSVAYIRARAWAMPAVLIITVGNGAYRGVEDTQTPLRIAIALNLVNLVLDPLLMFGLGWGLVGAAVASAVAQWAGAGLFLAAVLRRDAQRFRVPLRIPRLGELVPLLSVGSVLSLRTFSLVGTLTLATAVATRVGAAAVGAHQVAWQVWGMAALVVDALAVAGQALVARYQSSNPEVARAISNRLLQLGLGVGGLLTLGLSMVYPLIPWLLSNTPAAAHQLADIWWVVVAMQPINALIFVWDGVFLGSQRFRFLAVSMMLAAFGGIAVLAGVLPGAWGLPGVWAALVVINLIRWFTLAIGYWVLPIQDG